MKKNNSNNQFITVRHLHDENALKTYGHDGPLKSDQNDLIEKISKNILEILNESGKTKIRILYTEKTLRIKDTVLLISEVLKKNNIEIILQHEKRLEVMNQGGLILPDDYKDGDWFDPLDKAWDFICDEAYTHNNIFYRFGDNLNNKYPILKKSFSHFGESLGDSLIVKYSLIYDLIHGKFYHRDEQLLIVAQSDLPLVLMELEVLEDKPGVTSKNLPYKCWGVYKSGLQDEMYDKKAVGDGNFDIPMGYVGKFNLSSFLEIGFDKVIKKAEQILIKEKYENKNKQKK